MPEAQTGIDLARYEEDLSQALAQGTPCVLATSASDGSVDIGVKGSVFVFDRDHLAYLERTHGTHLSNVRQNSNVAIMYYNREAKAAPQVRFFGRAELYESGERREEIRNRTVARERERDTENRGVGVLVRIDRVIEPGGKVFTR
ncbi:MAG: pyridoxamine 5'-phosphate oxidase family protein [Chloroflexota bacterium]|nr:pyridoxamine 5'-phosphate oxidase family protein [Chloroflexota bacterium]